MPKSAFNYWRIYPMNNGHALKHLIKYLWPWAILKDLRFAGAQQSELLHGCRRCNFQELKVGKLLREESNANLRVPAFGANWVGSESKG
ncbi:hypothetical protein CEXT_577091 [Caerostris extrusa]|uniref:Uncharacterized protein n=1 Tax=Caerostris extrusa TaxID=172846 RepID=A0AAV4NPN6_CAEEX|nr:hypothetical protein CEXT_577091 [Caerostris extrusa]